MLRALGVALLVLAVSACSAGDEEDPINWPSGSTSASTAPSGAGTLAPEESQEAVRSRAAQVLRRAVLSLQSQPSVSFRHTTTFLDRTMAHVEGAYVFEGDAWQATQNSFEPESDIEYVMHARSVGGVVWMQMEGWPASSAGCWLVMKETEVPVGITALRAGQPGYVRALSGLRAMGFDPDAPSVIAGEMTMRAFSELLPGQLIAKLAPHVTSGISEQRVPARIAIDHGVVESVEVSGEDALAVIDEVSSDLPIEVTTFFDATRYRLAFLRHPGPTRIDPPDPQQVFSAGTKGCHQTP